MTIDEIKKLIQNGEKIDVEFKESKNALTKDVFDTVCSFNNRNGGHILLGINDKRDIVGVSEDRVDKVMKEFITSIISLSSKLSSTPTPDRGIIITSSGNFFFATSIPNIITRMSAPRITTCHPWLVINGFPLFIK